MSYNLGGKKYSFRIHFIAAVLMKNYIKSRPNLFDELFDYKPILKL